MFCGWVVRIGPNIFPAISKVGLIIIKADKPPFIDQAKCLGLFSIMFMYFWKAAGKAVLLMEYGVIIRELNKIKFGKNLFHLNPDVFIEAVIVANVQKS